MNKRLRLIGIIAAFVGSSALVHAADPPKAKPQQSATKPSLPPGVQVHRDLEYVAGGHARNKLDLYLPAKADHALPVIVWIHGGVGRLAARTVARRSRWSPKATRRRASTTA